MFKRLNLKIRLSVLLTLLVCCLSIYLISFNGIMNVLETHFLDMANQILVQKTQSLELFQESIKSIASEIASQEKIRYLLGTSCGLKFNPESDLSKYFNANRFLLESSRFIDGKILPYKAIEGATVLSVNGAVVITSDGLSTYPLAMLKSDSSIKNFIYSDNTSLWVIRTENIPDFYRNSPYIKQNGILSYIQKIFLRSTVIGFAVIDINPEYFYEAFASNDPDSPIYGISVSLIGRDFTTLPVSNEETFRDSLFLREGLISHDNASFKYIYPLSQADIHIGLILPSAPLRKDKFHVFFISTLALFFAMIISFIISLFFSKKIVEPLTKLHEAMQKPL